MCDKHTSNKTPLEYSTQSGPTLLCNYTTIFWIEDLDFSLLQDRIAYVWLAGVDSWDRKEDLKKDVKKKIAGNLLLVFLSPKSIFISHW